MKTKSKNIVCWAASALFSFHFCAAPSFYTFTFCLLLLFVAPYFKLVSGTAIAWFRYLILIKVKKASGDWGGFSLMHGSRLLLSGKRSGIIYLKVLPQNFCGMGH